MRHHTAKADVQGQANKGRTIHATMTGQNIEVSAWRHGVTLQREFFTSADSGIYNLTLLQSYCNAIAAQWAYNIKAHSEDKAWRNAPVI